jgi:hypothetical protein
VARARTIVRELESRRARGVYVPAYEIATVYATLGDPDAAFSWLDRTVESRSHSRAYFKVDPLLAPLRGDPRLTALVTGLGL